MLDEGSLTANLGTDGVVGKTGGREERNLLATGDRVHDIDGGDTSLDHLLRVVSLEWINGLTLQKHICYINIRYIIAEASCALTTYLNVEEAFSENGRTIVDGLALTVELATQHLSGDGHLQHVTSELTMRVGVVDISSTFKDLSQKFAD